MSDLKCFLAQNAMKSEDQEYIASKRFVQDGKPVPRCYNCLSAQSPESKKSLRTIGEMRRKEKMKAKGIVAALKEELDAPHTIEAKDICIEGALMLLKALWKSLEKDYYLCPKKRAGIEEYIMSPDFGKLYFNLEPEYVIRLLRESVKG